MAFMRFKTRLNSAVCTVLGSIHDQSSQRKIFTQLLAKLFAQIGHIGKGVCMLLPKPFPNLLCTEFFFAKRFKKTLQFLQAELPDIFNLFAFYGCCFSHRAKIPQCKKQAK